MMRTLRWNETAKNIWITKDIEQEVYPNCIKNLRNCHTVLRLFQLKLPNKWNDKLVKLFTIKGVIALREQVVDTFNEPPKKMED